MNYTDLDVEELSLKALMSKGPTLGSQYQMITTELRTRLTRMLRPFTNDPARFLRQLHASHAVISGSFALKWATAEIWEAGDLDVYVPKGNTNRFVDEMREIQGYVITADYPDDGDDRYGAHLMEVRQPTPLNYGNRRLY